VMNEIIEKKELDDKLIGKMKKMVEEYKKEVDYTITN